jgi:hypothetical protein
VGDLKFRKYRGPDVSTVLRRVRQELGDEAVIVKTEEKVEGGLLGFFGTRVVEVLVALPGEDHPGRRPESLDLSLPREIPGTWETGGCENVPQGGAPPAEGSVPSRPRGDVRDNVFPRVSGPEQGFLPLGVTLGEGDYPRRVLAFGPPGSGKTSTLGRLAWHFGPRSEVTLLSVEEEGRLSGASRWRAFWEVLGIKYHPVKGFQGLGDAVANEMDVLLVDTPPMEPGWRGVLERVCREFSLVPMLVVDAASDFEEFRCLLEEYGDLPGLRVVVSKLDAVRVPSRREAWLRELNGLPGYASDSPSICLPLKPLGIPAGDREEQPLRVDTARERHRKKGGGSVAGDGDGREPLVGHPLAAGRVDPGEGFQGGVEARPWIPRRLAKG